MQSYLFCTKDCSPYASILWNSLFIQSSEKYIHFFLYILAWKSLSLPWYTWVSYSRDTKSTQQFCNFPATTSYQFVPAVSGSSRYRRGQFPIQMTRSRQRIAGSGQQVRVGAGMKGYCRCPLESNGQPLRWKWCSTLILLSVHAQLRLAMVLIIQVLAQPFVIVSSPCSWGSDKTDLEYLAHHRKPEWVQTSRDLQPGLPWWES